MERAFEKMLGTVLVAIGVALLLFGFVTAYQEIQHLPSAKGPTAKFTWSLSGQTATLRDASNSSGAAITTVYWSFGDGGSNSSPDTSHTYGSPGSYTVTLEVQDANGASAQSTAELQVTVTGSSSGSSSTSGPVGNVTNVGSALAPLLGGVSGFLKTFETFVFLIVIWLVGGSILKGGWNLITPKAETISVRVKPRSLALEPASPAAPAAGPAPAPAGPTPPPPS